MGLDTIPNRNNATVIFAEWANVLRRVLGVGLHPRNTSGVVTDEGGNLGTASYKWLSLFSRYARVFSNNKFVTIKGISSLSADYDLELPNPPASSQTRKMLMDSTGKVTVPDISYQISSLISVNDTSGGSVDAASVTITSKGNPVEIGLVYSDSLGGHGGVWAEYSTGHAVVEIYRDSTRINFIVCETENDATFEFFMGVGCVRQLDFVTAGTYTYTLKVTSPASGKFIRVRNCKLYAREIL